MYLSGAFRFFAVDDDCIHVSGMPDSNRRPPAPKAGALANCANPRCNSRIID